jgi:hypothetical protein
MPRAFTINNPNVVHETIDGETILIHLGTGTYYSLDGVAAELWGLLLAGVSDGELGARLQARYDVEPGLAERSAAAFVRELLQEELVVELREGLAAEATAELAPGEEPGEKPAAGGVFAPPVLHKYTDMQEFMLVDPIHDVDAEAGWPHVKAEAG